MRMGADMVRIHTPDILSSETPLPLNVRVTKYGEIILKINGLDATLVNATDEHPLRPKYFALGAWNNLVGKWFFDCEIDIYSVSNYVSEEITNPPSTTTDQAGESNDLGTTDQTLSHNMEENTSDNDLSAGNAHIAKDDCDTVANKKEESFAVVTNTMPLAGTLPWVIMVNAKLIFNLQPIRAEVSNLIFQFSYIFQMISVSIEEFQLYVYSFFYRFH